MNREQSTLDNQGRALTSIGIGEVGAGLRHHWQSARSSDFIGKVAETYLTRIFLMDLALVTTVVVARLLGPAGRGYYAVAAATGALRIRRRKTA